jgi:hypothetical protein
MERRDKEEDNRQGEPNNLSRRIARKLAMSHYRFTRIDDDRRAGMCGFLTYLLITCQDSAPDGDVPAYMLVDDPASNLSWRLIYSLKVILGNSFRLVGKPIQNQANHNNHHILEERFIHVTP